MNVLGSIFLGDAQRPRILSSPSSPPSSPSRRSNASPNIDTMVASMSSLPPLATPLPPQINPEVSLELRVRWLEALLLGVKDETNIKHAGKQNGATKVDHATLMKQAEDLQRRLDKIVASNDGLRKFMENYDQHAQYLNPSFAISGLSSAPSYSSLSSEELDALLMEMEPEIKAADRDMREIEAMEKKGILGAGRLTDYETLLPRLSNLLKAHEEDLQEAAILEKRVATVLERYANRVDALSELFVEWNDVLIGAETTVTKIEKDLDERKRLGYV